MSEPTTRTPAPQPANAGPTVGASTSSGFPDVLSDPLLSRETPLGDLTLPSPLDLLLDGIDLACKLFEGDAHFIKGHTYQSLMAELAKYQEGDPTVGPLQLTGSFFTEHPSVPAYVKFGPDSPMTQQLMADTGVAGAREAYYLDGFDQTAAKFRLDDFIRETFELESPVQTGPGGGISDATLTEHQVGSYLVKICETPDQQLMFAVFNNTGAESLTRNPLTQESLLEDRERNDPGLLGTVHQVYYWTEPLRPR